MEVSSEEDTGVSVVSEGTTMLSSKVGRLIRDVESRCRPSSLDVIDGCSVSDFLNLDLIELRPKSRLSNSTRMLLEDTEPDIKKSEGHEHVG
jgi:hypothetical protein